MNCEEFVQSLSDRLQSLNGEQERHAASCRSCSAISTNRMRLTAGIAALAREWEGLSAPPRVEANLVAAFRGKAGIPVQPARPIWAFRLAWSSAMAATIVLAFFLVHGHQPPVRPAILTPHDLVQLAAAVSQSGTDLGVADAEGFIPLPNATQIAPDEEVNIVRLELPRASMIALGYAEGDDQASEAVEADVMLGADGMARAVRFVDE